MDDYMMEKWNSVVKPGDRVYHLGDVTFNYKKFDEVIAPRLHGSKRLILGNHDELGNKILQKHFTKVTLWRVFKEHGFLATHVPLRLDQFGYKGVLNVHGHIHQNLIDDHRFMNACVEHHDYTPIHLDTILKRVEDVKEINARIEQEAR
jgi:calcineurin-like phosphoesterase family protein